MGPERKAPENKKNGLYRNYNQKLQWGRSERLRKTMEEQTGWKRPYPSFNGAGAKGSGKLRRSPANFAAVAASMGPERKAPENGQLSPGP